MVVNTYTVQNDKYKSPSNPTGTVTRTYDTKKGSVVDTDSKGRVVEEDRVSVNGGYKESTRYVYDDSQVFVFDKPMVNPDTGVSEYNVDINLSNPEQPTATQYATSVVNPRNSLPVNVPYLQTGISPSIGERALRSELVVPDPEKERYGTIIDYNTGYRRYEYPIGSWEGQKERFKNVGGTFVGLGSNLVPFGRSEGFTSSSGNKVFDWIIERPVENPKSSLVGLAVAPSIGAVTFGVTSSAVGFREGVNYYYDSKIKNEGFNVGGLSYSEEKMARDVQLGYLDKTSTKFLENPLRWVGETTSYGFSKKSNLAGANEVVFSNFVEQGYSPVVARAKTNLAFTSFKRDIVGEFGQDIIIGIGSNFIGGALVGKGEKLLASTSLSSKSIYYSTRTVGMLPAGEYEAFSFVGARKQTTKNPVFSTSDKIWTGIGGLSAIPAQFFVEGGIKGVTFRYSGVTGSVKRAGLREGLLYATDPTEPISDAVSLLGNKGFRNVNVNTGVFSNAFTKTKSSFNNVRNNGFSYNSPILDKEFSFIPSSKVKSYPVVKSTSSFVMSNPFVNVKSFAVTPFTNMNVNSNALSNPFTEVNPFVNVEPTVFPVVKTNSNIMTNPFTNTNPFVNVNPVVNPNTNPFVNPNVFVGGKFPFVAPFRGFGSGDFGFGKKSRRKTVYAPSLTALGLGLKSKKKVNTLTGLGVRPIVY